VARLRELLAERGPESERAESTKEIRVLSVIRQAGLRMPVAQYWVVARGERFRFDAAYPDLKVGLEYLGFDPHRSRTAFDHDHRRDRILTLEGWTVVYFTSASTDAEIERTVGELLAAFGG
jgi:very-short-patch-repair endonuclease